MIDVKKIEYVSAAKVFAVYGLIVGIVFGVLFIVAGTLVGGLLSTLLGSSIGSLVGGSIGAVAAVIFIVGGLIGGAISGVIFALLYNLLTSRWVKIEASDASAKSLTYLSVAKTNTLITLIFGIVVLIFSVAGGGTAILAAVFSLIGDVISGFIGGLVLALLYNVLISRFAAFKVE